MNSIHFKWLRLLKFSFLVFFAFLKCSIFILLMRCCKFEISFEMQNVVIAGRGGRLRDVLAWRGSNPLLWPSSDGWVLPVEPGHPEPPTHPLRHQQRGCTCPWLWHHKKAGTKAFSAAAGAHQSRAIVTRATQDHHVALAESQVLEN